MIICLVIGAVRRVTDIEAFSVRGWTARSKVRGFTLVELLVVIAIVTTLMAITVPAIHAVKTGAARAHAAADVQRIVVAVNAFDTEYGRLPAITSEGREVPGQDVAVGDRHAGMKIPNRELFYILRAIERGNNRDAAVNYRRVVFFDGSSVKNPEHPASGFLDHGLTAANDMDCFFDPWERQYCIALDYSGDGRTKLAYLDFAGDNAPPVRVAAFSIGPDESLGNRGDQSFRKGSTRSDDIVSW
jgi:prepilin-type N-terminal cleavage/methylation domain-containing protein